jgi:cobalt transporter subunit CbtB
MIETRAISRPTVAATTSTALAAVVAMLLGAFLVYGVGFASPSTIHNAAHDGRHSFAFPCH